MRFGIFILALFLLSNAICQTFCNPNKVYKVPVVVHIIYLDSSQLISLSSVQDQISSLNKDFSKTNTDISLMSNIWQGLSANTAIEFVLSNRDPNQVASTGITVNNTNQYQFIDYESPKKSVSGGVEPWDTKKYLNIWVCYLQDQDLGSAVQPWDDNKIDGIVINLKYFGANSDTVYNEGRVLTYLVGKWLGIDDISKGSNCPGAENKTCIIEGDKICDTPPMDFDMSNCTGDQINTCTEEVDQPDMLSNFMSLRADSCRLFFTRDQADKMRRVLCSYKDELLNNYMALSPYENKNIGLSDLIIENDPCLDSAILSLYIEQFGIDTLQSYELNYQIDGGSTISYQQNKSLAMYERDTIDFSVNSLGQGLHNVKFWVSAIDGSADQYNYNDTISRAFYNYDSINTVSFPFEIDFELDSLDYKYAFRNIDYDKTWAHTYELPGKDSLPTKAIMINHYRYSGNGNEDVFLTPPINVAGLDSPKLFFDLAYAKFSSFNYERLILSLKRACSGNDTVLLDKSGSALQTVYSSKSHDWYPEPADWKTYLLDLTAFGNETFQLEYKVINGYGNNLFIDNIIIADTVLPSHIAEMSDKEINLYPNPAKDILYIDNKENNITEFTIYNTIGNRLAYSSGYNIERIDLSKLKPGLYFIELRTEEHTYTYKISHL